MKIKFFGAFRQYGESIDLPVELPSTVADVKDALQSKLDDGALVSDSVLANDNRILRDADIIADESCLSILPPISGGFPRGRSAR